MSEGLVPFQGVNILDFTRLLPGPWATALAADYGAKVLKIEPPGIGDYSREAPPFVDGKSVYFEEVNRNKKGIQVDLKTRSGIELVRDLAKSADIVVESFRPGTMDRLGMGFDQLSRSSPRLIYCSVSGFGQDGPYSQAAGHDINILGVAGVIPVENGTQPTLPAILAADFAGATSLAMAMMAGLLERERTKKGLWLDVSMLDGLISWGTIRYAEAVARIAKQPRTVAIQSFGGNPRYNIYQCSDGKWVTVALLEKKFWARFCEYVGRGDLINEEEKESDRLSTHGSRGDTYRAALESIFKRKRRDVWVKELLAQDIPCFPAYSPDEVWEDEHVKARMLLVRGEHHDSSAPTMSYLRSPIRTVNSNSENLAYEPFEQISNEGALEFFVKPESIASVN